MARHSTSFDVRAALVSSAESVCLLGLWMIFVSMAKLDELLVGIAAALIAAFADGVVKAKKFATFYPHLKTMLLVFWELWYVLKGTVIVFGALIKRLLGNRPQIELRAVPFDAGGRDSESAARRALAILLTTISPDTITIGIHREKNVMLAHYISPSGTHLIAKRLGATE